MHKLLEIHKLPNHIEENIVNIIKLTIMVFKDSVFLIKIHLMEKSLGPDNFSGEFY